MLHTILAAFARRRRQPSPVAPCSNAFAWNRIGRLARYRPLNDMKNVAAQLTSPVLAERPRVAPVNRATHFVEGRIETRPVRSEPTSASRYYAGSTDPLPTVTSNLVATTWPSSRTRTAPKMLRRLLAREP